MFTERDLASNSNLHNAETDTFRQANDASYEPEMQERRTIKIHNKKLRPKEVQYFDDSSKWH